MAISASDRLRQLMNERIVILDGAMGTQIQAEKLGEDDFRGSEWQDHPSSLMGNNDLLCLSQPELIRRVHKEYLDAGADIIETNTFGATSIALEEYGLGSIAEKLNRQAALCAVSARDDYYKQGETRPIWIAGSLGPTPKSASISSDVNDPGNRSVDFDELAEAYRQAAKGLLTGGADLLLVETIFDTLNGKAAIFGSQQAMEDHGCTVPILISFTLTDLAGRTLSGQTADAAVIALEHARALAMGMNCALGPKELHAFVGDLSRHLPYPLLVYPNAGLPNVLGGYDETPESFSSWIRQWAESGYVNIVGGCCGTTPDHIAAVREAMMGCLPRQIPQRSNALLLAGMEAKRLATPVISENRSIQKN